jgi:hypothetical protein
MARAPNGYVTRYNPDDDAKFDFRTFRTNETHATWGIGDDSARPTKSTGHSNGTGILSERWCAGDDIAFSSRKGLSRRYQAAE